MRPAWDITYLGFVLGHGGDAQQMLALAQGMRDLGARVNIIVPRLPTSEAFAERCKQAGINCVRSELITADARGTGQRLRSVHALLRQLDTAIVHFHTGNSCLPRSVMVAMELLRFPTGFVTLHSPYETIEPGSARARFWAFTANRRFEAVVSPSDHGAAFQVRCGVTVGRVATVRNAVDVANMSSGDGRGPRAQLGLAPRDPMILFCSRLDPQKRPVDAVRAFARVANQHHSAVLVFAGIGQESVAVENEARILGLSGRVHLVGYQLNVTDWLAAATVWILPTERENFSIALLEAFAAGCPVLATMCPGNDELLVEDVNAITFAVGDIEAAAAGLARLLSDQDLRTRLASGARASAKQYSTPRMIEQYRQLYARSLRTPDSLRSEAAVGEGSR